MEIFKVDSLKIEMQGEYSLEITPVPHSLQESEEPGTEKPLQSKEEVSVWKI